MNTEDDVDLRYAIVRDTGTWVVTSVNVTVPGTVSDTVEGSWLVSKIVVKEV